MSSSLGEQLRAAREERGISVSEVAEQTRIAPLYIQSIEDDNYKPLPGGIFNKGFVRSYARYIGFDENEALAEYSRIVAQNEGTPDEDMRTYRPEVLTDDRTGPSILPTIIFAGIILALMTGGVLFLVSYIQNQPATTSVTPTPTPASNDVNAPLSTPEVTATNGPTMQNLKVEFRTASEPISLSATSDGKTSISTVTPSTPQTFEPRQSLRLSYSKSLAASAQMFVNGKQIQLPSTPANPKRVPIEIDINAGNLNQIWSSGQFQFASAQPAATQTPAQTAPAPGATTTPRAAATPAPRPATTPAAASTVRPTPTPIIVGRPRPANARTPN